MKYRSLPWLFRQEVRQITGQKTFQSRASYKHHSKPCRQYPGFYPGYPAFWPDRALFPERTPKRPWCLATSSRCHSLRAPGQLCLKLSSPCCLGHDCLHQYRHAEHFVWPDQGMLLIVTIDGGGWLSRAYSLSTSHIHTSHTMMMNFFLMRISPGTIGRDNVCATIRANLTISSASPNVVHT